MCALLGNDHGLTDVIARTLGPGFIASRSNDWNPSMAGEREDCDVVLLDLRAATGDAEYGLSCHRRDSDEMTMVPLPSFCAMKTTAI